MVIGQERALLKAAGTLGEQIRADEASQIALNELFIAFGFWSNGQLLVDKVLGYEAGDCVRRWIQVVEEVRLAGSTFGPIFIARKAPAIKAHSDSLVCLIKMWAFGGANEGC